MVEGDGESDEDGVEECSLRCELCCVVGSSLVTIGMRREKSSILI